MKAQSLCAAEECLEPAFSRGLCLLHLKRAQRGKPLDAPNRRTVSELAWLVEMALHIANLDAEEDHAAWRAAEKRLDRAALKRARALGWAPPG